MPTTAAALAKAQKFNEGMTALFGDAFPDNVACCGGNWGSHERYFNIIRRAGDVVPAVKEFCPCGNAITRQAYAWNPETRQMEVVGSCCMKKLGQTGMLRTCEDCRKVHRNRSDNFCSACREARVQEERRRYEEQVEERRRMGMSCEQRRAYELIRALLLNPPSSPWERNFITDVSHSYHPSPKQIRLVARIANDHELQAAIESKCNY
jgi:hypothetical protein